MKSIGPHNVSVVIAEVLSSPATHSWLKTALQAALAADPVDALNNVEVLHEILDARWEEMRMKQPVR